MSSTTKLIEGMTDYGEFEKLALAVLRRMRREECAAIIHEGINADGRPIPSKVDAFVVVPGTRPPRCIMIACTIEKHRGLRKKWLFDHQNPTVYRIDKSCGRKRKHQAKPEEDGDLIKVIRDAEKKRLDLPDAIFKVFLVTNRCGVGDLATAVTAIGSKGGVETEIVDASILTDFLHIEPAGQFVLSHFFGNPVNHVSPDLMAQIGRNSLKQRQSRPDFQTATHLITRDCTGDLMNMLAGRAGLVWVVAPPGKGKSVLVVDAANQYMNNGGFALWLSENDVANSEALWQAVDSALRRECPSLEPEAGRRALELVTDERRLLLIIDDVNQLPNPDNAFQKIQAWVRCSSTEKISDKTEAKGSNRTVVCPIWPQHHSKIVRPLSHTSDQQRHERMLEVCDLSDSEVKRLFSGIESAAQTDQIAQELCKDPLLCSIAANEIRNDPTAIRLKAREVLQRYLNRQIDGVAAKMRRAVSEYRNALRMLANSMLERKNLRPNWVDVTVWIAVPEMKKRLSELLGERKVIHLEAVSERLLFTHDRFLDSLCAECVPTVIANVEVRSEPFFSEIIGRSIAENHIPEQVVIQILEDNPLAVFCGLMFAVDSALQRKLVALLSQWAMKHNASNDQPDGLWWEIGRVLLKTDCPDVANYLIGSLPNNLYMNLAGLRNGSANYGINYCREWERRHFLPAIHSEYRDSIVEHALLHHKQRLVEELTRDLEQRCLPIEIRCGALILAGFLAADELTKGIEYCWKNCPPDEQPQLVPEAIWAIVRCSKNRYPELLPEVFNVWQETPDTTEKAHQHPRSDIAFYYLGHCQPNWMPDQVASWLASSLSNFPRLQQLLEYLLSRSDTPSACEYIVRQLASNKRKEGTGVAPYFIMHNWFEGPRKRQNLSEATRQRLRSIWTNTTELPEERDCAFQCWLLSATAMDLKILRAFPPNDAFYKSALSKRIRLGDRSCIYELSERLLENNFLLFDLPPVWSPILIPIVLKLLKSQSSTIYHDESQLAAWFLSLPKSDAEILLIESWDNCGEQLGFRVAALLLGSAKADSLLGDISNDAKQCDQLLECAQFVMMVTWPYLNVNDFLVNWLNRCVPYLQLASQDTLYGFSDVCRSPGSWQWHDANVKPLLRAESRTKANEKCELPFLETQLRRSRDLQYASHRFFEELEARGVSKEQTIQRFAQECRAAPSEQNVSWLAACIATAGSRKDLALLDGNFAGVDELTLKKTRRDCAFTVMRRTLSK